MLSTLSIDTINSLSLHAQAHFAYVAARIHQALEDVSTARQFYHTALERAISAPLSHSDQVDMFREALAADDVFPRGEREAIMQRYVDVLERHAEMSEQSATRIITLRTNYYQRLSDIELERHEAHQREIANVANSILQNLSNDIHDKVGQDLALAGLDLDVALHSLDSASDLHMKISAIRQRITRVSRDLRTLAHGASANTLETLGLDNAIRELLADVNSAAITTHCTVSTSRALSHEDDFFFYRCAHILVSNVLRHAKATRISVQLIDTQNERQLIIDDNGSGFDTRRAATGMGFRELRARASLHRATVLIDSEPDVGSTVLISLPIRH
jgi:signal transduction histidine kinase